MWRSKKFIIIAVLAVVALAGSIGGVVLAQTGDEDNSPQAQQQALMEKVCAIYQQNTGVAIDSAELQKAFDQVQSEMRQEAQDKFLQSLVDEGKITQEQADQYKAWLEAKPDIPLLGPGPLAPGFPGAGMRPGFGGPGGGFPGGGEPPTAE